MAQRSSRSTPAGSADRQRRQRYLALIYAVIFMVILISAYTGFLPVQFLGQLPGYDKIGHVVLYAIAVYFGHSLMGDRVWLGQKLPIFPIGFGLATITEEFLQKLSPHRTFSRLDLTCSLTGILIGWYLGTRARRSFNATPQACPRPEV